MYKLLSSSKGSDDLSIGFDRDRTRRRNELTNNKNIKGKYHVRIYLKISLVTPNINKKVHLDWVTN